MQKKTLIIVLAVYVASAVGSYGVFSVMGKSSPTSNTGNTNTEFVDEETALSALLQIDPGEPKDQPCPISGQLYTKTEKDAWSTRRPLAVMIENAPDARPQSGLSRADVVFEAVAEGGVTRFMPIFYCGVQQYDTVLAPVRSARSYFIDWASGFNEPMYVHVGGANIPGPADALGQINSYGWALENDINQFSVSYPTFIRNANRLDGKAIATEHTMETSTERLWEVAADRDWTNLSPERKVGRKVIAPQEWLDGYTPWKFSDSVSPTAETTSISYGFWSGYGQYDVRWEYDLANNNYKRILADQPHVDLNDGKQITAKNVVVLLTKEKGPIDEAKHMLYTTTGTGNALLFRNGQMQRVAWAKKDRESQIIFTDTKGKEVEFTPGMIWISVLDTASEVKY